jgi:biotin operon repressor
MQELLNIRDPAAAATLLQHPVRRRILAEAAERAVSAAELAGLLGQPRQRLNYHVRQLARSGFLELAGRRRKRNMEESRWVATARAYVLTPQLLPGLEPSPERIADQASAAHLQALMTQGQRELADVTEAATAAGVRLLTLSLRGELRFEGAAQRASFGRALLAAVAQVVAEHTSPAAQADGQPAPGQPFRLVLGVYPVARGGRDG